MYKNAIQKKVLRRNSLSFPVVAGSGKNIKNIFHGFDELKIYLSLLHEYSYHTTKIYPNPILLSTPAMLLSDPFAFQKDNQQFTFTYKFYF